MGAASLTPEDETDAETRLAGRDYWVFCSASGVTPGILLGGFSIPLNPDPYSNLLVGETSGTNFQGFRSNLGASSRAQARIVFPPLVLSAVVGVKVHHSCLVFDNGGIVLVSNPVPVTVSR